MANSPEGAFLQITIFGTQNSAKRARRDFYWIAGSVVIVRNSNFFVFNTMQEEKKRRATL